LAEDALASLLGKYIPFIEIRRSLLGKYIWVIEIRPEGGVNIYCYIG